MVDSTPFVVPIEAALPASPSSMDVSALECLIRGYMTKNIVAMWSSTARGSQRIQGSAFCVSDIYSSLSPQTETLSVDADFSINRASLLIPILPCLRQKFQHIRSLRLGDYGRAISSVEEYVRSEEVKALQQLRKTELIQLNGCSRLSSIFKQNRQVVEDLHEIQYESDLNADDEESFHFFLSCNTFTDRKSATSTFEIESFLERNPCTVSPSETSVEHPTGHSGTAPVPSSTRSVHARPLVFPAKNVCLTYEALFFQLHDDSTTTTLIPLKNDAVYTASSSPSAMPSIKVVQLPHEELEGLWESLLYGDTLTDSQFFKQELLRYMQTSLLFGAAEVNTRLIQWNRLMLFYGPPGTGKTSICKALAQKLSIVLHSVFPKSSLIEIQSPHVFSRFFSESGKQVIEIFDQIRALAQDHKRLVVLIMDEVESLVASRESSVKGNDPSETVRVVNTILTQMDALQKQANILVLCTSNMMDLMDSAFVDRVDKKVFVGPPGSNARRWLIRSSLTELINKQLVSKPQFFVPSVDESEVIIKAVNLDGDEYKEKSKQKDELPIRHALACTRLLNENVRLSEGLSGRFLRKVPFLAFARACEELGLSNIFSTLQSRNRKKDDDNTSDDESHAKVTESLNISIIRFLRCMLSLVQCEVNCQNPSSFSPHVKRHRHEDNHGKDFS